MKLYWVSFLDGMQRVILFTEDIAIMMMAQQVSQWRQCFTNVAQCPVLGRYRICQGADHGAQHEPILKIWGSQRSPGCVFRGSAPDGGFGGKPPKLKAFCPFSCKRGVTS